MTRREAVQLLIAGAMAAFSAGYPERGFASDDDSGNFRHIYLDPKLRDRFFLFLKNVFHLYPEAEFHRLITEKASALSSDKEIYQAILSAIPSIKPVLADVRYALPSLKKQKETMCAQTVALLDGRKKLDGYLEIGTTGRYFDRLHEMVKISGPKVFVNTDAPTYGAADIIERGQIRKVGTFVPLNDYHPIPPNLVRDESLDLVTVYIGFHHSPPVHRQAFMNSCRRVLRPGGMLIVRDHDVTTSDMVHFVALAHDVFNAGLELPWSTNDAEIRNFTSLSELESLMTATGFTPDARRLLQEGDPTDNTLIKFVRS